MVDALKIAAKVALIVIVTAAILIIFANVQIPTLDYTFMINGMETGLAVLYHWIPIANVIMPVIYTCLGIRLAILVFEITAIAWRWIFKINE